MTRERMRPGSVYDGCSDGESGELAAPDLLDRRLEKFVEEGAPPLSRGEALRVLGAANEAAGKLECSLTLDRYVIGEALVAFAGRRGHVTLGYESLGRCLRERFRLGRTWAYESMRLVRLATKDELKGMPWAIAHRGLELATLLKADSFRALAEKDLPVPLPDGEPARFPASAEVLEAALRILRWRRGPAEEDPDTARPVEKTVLRRAQGVLDQCLADHPALAAAKPRVYVHGGKAHVRLGAMVLRSETFAAVHHLFDQLERALRKG